MYFSKAQKVLLLVGTFLPLVITGVNYYLFFTQLFTFMQDVTSLQPASADEFEEAMSPFFFFNQFKNFYLGLLIAWVVGIAVLVVMIIHLVKDKRLKSEERVMWVLLLVFLGAITKPIYFFMRIWSQERPDPSQPPPITQTRRHNRGNDLIINN